MDIYNITDNETNFTAWIVGNGGGAGTSSIDISSLEYASGDDTDRMEILSVKWIIPGSTDSISLAWDNGAGAAGSTFFTMAGQGGPQNFPSSFDADTIEGYAAIPAAGMGDLYITSTANDFTLIISFQKTEGFGGWPAASGHDKPFGTKELT